MRITPRVALVALVASLVAASPSAQIFVTPPGSGGGGGTPSSPTSALFTTFGPHGVHGMAPPPSITQINLANVGGNYYALAGVFRAQEAATITHLGFRYEQRVGTVPTYRISMQSVASTPQFAPPTGTVLGGASPASATFTPPSDASWNATWQWVALANSYTLARGELFAIVIEYSSGTIDGSNFGQFDAALNNVDSPSMPYVIGATAAGPATWTAPFTGAPLLAYKSASKVYGYPVETIGAVNFSSDSTPDEYAMAFTIPAEWYTGYTVAGLRANLQFPTAGKTINVVLYSGTTVLQTVAWDTDNARNQGNGGALLEVYFTDTTLAALDGGTQYRIAIQPQDTGTLVNVPTLGMDSANDRQAWAAGANCYLSTRTNAGAWTDDTTKLPLMQVILGTITR
jgi:hypothetical protein